MFTGLVEGLGRVKALDQKAQSLALKISLGPLSSEVKVGDSLSLNGCCLTVASIESDQATFDVMFQTLKLTSLGQLEVSSSVNLERALAVNSRLGGHFVTGHVDGLARVKSIEDQDQSHLVTFSATKGSSHLADDMVLQGSVAVDGVSLTIMGLDRQAKEFSVSIIPHTFAQTLFSKYSIGDQVNIETDMINKFVRSHVERILASQTTQK